MLPSTDRALNARIALAAVLVVLLPFAMIYAFVAATNWLFLPLLEALGYGPYHGEVYVEPWLAAVVVLGGLVTQIVAGPRTVLGRIGARSRRPEQYPDLHADVSRLAQQADVPEPEVAIVDSDAPNAAAVHGPTGAAIVATTGLLETLDDDEREAVLAHEVAHLRHRDALVMTVAWFLPTITYYLATAAAYVLYGIYHVLGYGGGGGDGDGEGAAKALIVLVVTAVVTLAISALFWAASVVLHRVLARHREYAADRAAADLTGDPAALASALTTLDDEMPDAPDRDLRKLDGGAEALYVAPLEGRAFTDAELVSTDIFPSTHPPTSDRVDRLLALAGGER